MKNISRKAGLFIKKNGVTILTGVAAVGVIGTAVATAKGTTKASTLLDQATLEKGEDLTKMEMLNVALPAYIPAIMLGTITVASIIGVSIINKKRQASLMSGYMMLDGAFKQYRAKVDELYGEGSDKEIQEAVDEDNFKKLALKGEDQLYFDVSSGKFFRTTLFDMQRIEYEMNRDLMLNEFVSLNDWYDRLGVDAELVSDEVGWTYGMLMSMYWQPWLDFNHQRKTTDEGEEYIEVSFWQEPIEDCEDYY